MVSYMPMPKYKLTLDGTELTNDLISAKVTRLENGFDSATITLNDTAYYPATVTENSTVQLEVKDESDSVYTTILKGVVRFVVPDISPKPKGKSLTLSCLGSGYGLAETVVAAEYGTQSNNPTIDTLAEVIDDITDNYLNKILAGPSSGFTYTNACSLTNPITYINFPYKPVDKCLSDLIDLMTAQEAGNSGPHWIMTTDDVLHVHQIGQSQTGWTKYYGNSQANATLTYGTDYFNINLEKMSPEANYILYYGAWRRPSNGDAWTEASTTGWGSSGITLSSDSTYHVVGSKSLRATANNTSINSFYYPSTKNAGWNIAGIGSIQYIPTLNLYFSKHQTIPNLLIMMCTDDSNYYTTQQIGSGTTYLAETDKFYHFEIPIGQNWDDASAPDTKIIWSKNLGGSPDWANINFINFLFTASSANDFINVDGLHMGTVPICRVAWNSDLPGGGKVKMRLITDNIGKDDTLKSGTPGTTDTGLMAQLAYSELLRLQKTSLVGTVETPMIKDALPGQYFNIQSADFRATKLIHNIIPNGVWTTLISITDDVTNSRARVRYEDINKQWSSIRPEWQDRQAASIKAGNVDLAVPRLVEDYAP